MADAFTNNEVILSTCAKITSELGKKGLGEAIEIVHNVQYDLIRNSEWRYSQTEKYLGKFFEAENKVWQVIDCTTKKGSILARDMGFPIYTNKSFEIEGLVFTSITSTITDKKG